MLFAQTLPHTDGLVGNDNLIWVVGFLISLLAITNYFWYRRDINWENKYDALQDKTLKLALRSQKAIEALANLPLDEDTDEA